MPNPISLKDLVGSHLLRGVDTPKPDEYKLADWIRFQLGDTVYLATENPSDEYRSYMDRIEEVDEAIVNPIKPAIRVTARMKDPSDPTHHSREYDWDSDCSVLQLVHAKTGQVLVEVGTVNEGDYYPSWVARFWPERMGA